jgi:hypothetical protein
LAFRSGVPGGIIPPVMKSLIRSIFFAAVLASGAAANLNNPVTIILYYPGMSPEVHKVMDRDYKITSPGCIEIYAVDETINFCGTYKIRRPKR